VGAFWSNNAIFEGITTVSFIQKMFEAEPKKWSRFAQATCKHCWCPKQFIKLQKIFKRYTVKQGHPRYRPRDKSCPRSHFYPAAKIYCQQWKIKYIYKNLVDLVECNISRNNHIT